MSSSALLIPNLSILCYTNNDIINNKIKVQEQKTKIMKELTEIAERELRETESNKRECLTHMREWIKQNPDLENCLTDDNFLLRFLRVRKFSLHLAQQTLLKYLNLKIRFQEMMFGLDYTMPAVYELFATGYILVSPFRDAHGRRVVIVTSRKLDLSKYTGSDMIRTHLIALEALLEDEPNQILGVRHVADINAVSPAYLSLMSITDFTCLIRWGEQSYPIRFKEINLVNLPKPLRYVFDYAISHMSAKLKERFKTHATMEDLHQNIDKRCLPEEMGGDMPAKEMIRLWFEELQSKQDRLMSVDRIRLLSDKGIIRRRNAMIEDSTGTGSLAGTFRKLELD